MIEKGERKFKWKIASGASDDEVPRTRSFFFVLFTERSEFRTTFFCINNVIFRSTKINNVIFRITNIECK